MSSKRCVQLVYVFFVAGCIAFGHERIRPEKLKDFRNGASVQSSVFVPGTRVSYANHEALKRDFPELRSHSNQDINNWLIQNFSFISERQIKLNGIRNSHIPINADIKKENLRPYEYNRAAILSAEIQGKSIGLVDIKGFGHRDENAQDQIDKFAAIRDDSKELNRLRTRGHSDGLMRHGEAIAELTRQTAIQRLYDVYNDQEKTDYQTVESYFIIELPFDVLGPDGKADRAALYGRQAHWRGSHANYPGGIYSDDHGKFQGTLFESAVDFGGAMVDLDNRLKEKFGFSVDAEQSKNPQFSLPWIKGHQIADKFRDGDERAVYEHLDEMLSPIASEWSNHGTSLEPQTRLASEYVKLLNLSKKEQLNKTDARFIKAFRLRLESIRNAEGGLYNIFELERLQRSIIWRAFDSTLTKEQMTAIASSHPGVFNLFDFSQHQSWDNFEYFLHHSQYGVRKHALKFVPNPLKQKGVEEAKKYGIYESQMKTAVRRVFSCLTALMRLASP